MHILFLNVSARNLTCRIGPVCMACTNTIIVHIQSFLQWFPKIVMIQEKRDFNSCYFKCKSFPKNTNNDPTKHYPQTA